MRLVAYDNDSNECRGNIKDGGKVCDWKVYGLFGGLGKDVFVFCKDKLKGERMFMPLAWEEGSV